MRPGPGFRTVLSAALALLCLNAPATAPAQEGRPAEGDAPPGQKYALLVGVCRYQSDSLRPLQFPEKDVTDLAEVLHHGGYRPENVWLMTYAEAAKDRSWYPDGRNVRRKLAKLLEDRRPGDSILVALAGHGVQFRGEKDAYFCPVDADLGDRNSLISLNRVYDQLQACGAGAKVVLVDACRNDPVADTSRAARVVEIESKYLQRQEPPGGVAVLYSCSEGQEAFEDDRLGHGIFFHYVIEGLKGKAASPDRAVTLTGLYDYLAVHVDDFARRYKEHSQRPELRGDFRGRPPVLAFAGDGPAAKPPVTPPPVRPTVAEPRPLGNYNETVSCVALLPDGRRALAGGFDGSLRLWDLEAGKEVRTLRADAGAWVWALAVSPDGRLALSGGQDRVVHVWDLEAGKEVGQFRGHTHAVRGLAFSPDGTLAVSGSEDGTLRLWQVATGKELGQLRGHRGAVMALAVAAGGHYVLSGGADRTVRLWDVDTGRELRRFEGHADEVWGVAFSPGGSRAVSCSRDGTLRLWDVQTGQELHCLRGPGAVQAVAFSPDGRLLLSGGVDRLLSLWDADTGELLSSFRGQGAPIFCLALAPDGRQALSGGGGYGLANGLRLWRLPGR